ncbi:uncharacterized protein LOC131672209 isoform X2 [Phymastichus coffea]|uniref:uncharacterized protein LOC131672209 isoform X2 n=1 Tax=Phymastichus coffea TaxID=108790 RepID=UPI00273CE0C3|nr:uncharacterized protein LOC131672209 isoform X2 [Phymastichus coffea]
METTDGPAAISINPSTIKASQEEMGRLDVLVCGQCHSVFHFIEEFQEHRSKEGACSKQSHFRESSNNEQKAQVWAFLLWKDTHIQQDSPDKDTSWNLYKKWCQMEPHVRECWIAAGKTIQTFTKISNTKMTDVPRQQGTITTEGGRRLVVHKLIRNGQPENSGKKEIKPDIKMKLEPIEKGKVKLKPSIKPKAKNESGENAEDSDDDYIVEKILAKRFNPKKKVYEYLLKWEGYAHEHNTWEEVENVSATCKQLMDEFEKNLAKQKELKALHVQKSIAKANQMGVGFHKEIKRENVKAGPSTSSPKRPMRSSKSKAMDNVKNWVGVMKNEEERDLLGKRKIPFSDSDSDDGDLAGLRSMKRSKADTSGDDDWTAESEEDKVTSGRSDVIQKAFSRAQNGSQSNSMFAKNVKTETKPQSTVYLVHRKDGVIRLDQSPTDSIALKASQISGGSGVLMVQNREGNLIRKRIVTSDGSSANSITCEKVISKPDGTQVVTQMKVVPKSSPAAGLGLQTSTPKVVTAMRTAGTAASPRTSTDGGGRPLLPRPAGVRGATSTTSSPMAIAQTRTPVRAPLPKQGTTVGAQQRQILQQKKTGGTSTIVQVAAASPNALPSVRPKITVMNAQGPLMQKIVSPAGKPSPKAAGATSSVAARPLPSLTTTQKIQAAKKKAEQEAGVSSKTGARGNTTAARAGARANKAKVTTAAGGNKPKESKLAVTGGLHMEFHQVESEDSSDGGETEFPPLPAAAAQSASEPDSPPRLTLCPLTGRIIGPDGQPIEQPELEQPQAAPAPQVTPVAIVPASTTATISPEGIITTVAAGENSAELVLPTMEGLAESSGAVMRVEMSPGGTTGMIVQANESTPVTLANVVVPGPDLPCLDDPNIEVQTTSTGGVVVNVSTSEAPASVPSSTATETTAVVATTTTTDVTMSQPLEVVPTTTEVALATVAGSNVKLENPATQQHQLVTLTGEDGVVYQVAGQAENGQTLLVAQGADGEQQCVYVTTADAGQGEEGQVLTIDHAVAEAVAQLIPGSDQVNLAQQFYVKEGETTAEGAEAVATPAEGQVVMSVVDNADTVVAAAPEEGEAQAQVVAQVIQADPPSADGRRRVVLLLPDGNLMMTEVDEEQYAALELDK